MHHLISVIFTQLKHPCHASHRAAYVLKLSEHERQINKIEMLLEVDFNFLLINDLLIKVCYSSLG